MWWNGLKERVNGYINTSTYILYMKNTSTYPSENEWTIKTKDDFSFVTSTAIIWLTFFRLLVSILFCCYLLLLLMFKSCFFFILFSGQIIHLTAAARLFLSIILSIDKMKSFKNQLMVFFVITLMLSLLLLLLLLFL